MNGLTVYLDTSTLADAFDAVHGSKSTGWAAYERLYTLLGKISTEHTLVLSFGHVAELLSWAPYARVLERAEWLDRLAPKWAPDFDRAALGELEWWLRDEMNLPRPPAYQPISPAFVATIEGPSTPSGAAEFLRDPSIARIVRDTYSRVDELSDLKQESVKGFRALLFGRQMLPPGTSEEELRRHAGERNRTNLLEDALRLRSRLSSAAFPVTNDDIRKSAERLFANADALPLNRLHFIVMGRLLQRITDQQPRSAAFDSRYGSISWDLQHLTGAAYCDVFTCDHRIDMAIGSFRTGLGHPPQLSVKGQGGPDGFVKALSSQVGG